MVVIVIAPVAAPDAAQAGALGSRVLQRGDSGQDVKILQRLLLAKGYRMGGVDGAFGRRTKAAVRRFQRRRGLGVDGRVGPQTTRALASSWRPVRASYYGPGLYGNRTACGRKLTRRIRGVAHRSLPCGRLLPVYHAGRIGLYRVIDRGPFVKGRSLDLTAGAARELRMSSTSDVRARY